MKNMRKFFLFIIAILLIIPFTVKAAEKKYNTLNFREALAEEEIEEEFTNYKETDDQAIIYLFRGKGCGYCRAFLTFMNSIADEYGKYFKIVSYEVWNDADNATLMSTVSKYMGDEARGVPYIIIGDKVFTGYTSSYDEDIKSAITDLYNTKAKKRYDVFKEMKKNPNKDSGSSFNFSNSTLWIMIIVNLALVTVLYVLIINHINNKVKELKEVIEKTEHKEKEHVKEKETKKKK